MLLIFFDWLPIALELVPGKPQQLRTHWVAVEVFGTIFHFAQRLKWMHISFQNSVGVCGKAVVPELVLTASSTSRVWTSSPRAGFLGGCLLLVVFIILC